MWRDLEDSAGRSADEAIIGGNGDCVLHANNGDLHFVHDGREWYTTGKVEEGGMIGDLIIQLTRQTN